MRENLIYHSAKQGVASYGRDGGEGRDIMVAPSRGFEADKQFLQNLRAFDTTTVSVLDAQPSSAMYPTPLQSSLKKLMSVWGKTKNFGFLYAPAFNRVADEFIPSVMDNVKRAGLNVNDIDMRALDVLKKDVEETMKLGADLFDPNDRLRFLLLHYPAESRPMLDIHEWHNHEITAKNKITLQRSPVHKGMSFQFKEQASDYVVNGVALSTGRAVFKNGPEDKHKGPPVSPTEDRMMYAITGKPRSDVLFPRSFS